MNPTPEKNAGKKLVMLCAEQTVAADGTITMRPLHYSPMPKMVDIRTAAKISGRSIRFLQQLCDEGRITSAKKMSDKPQSHWRISAADAADLAHPF